MATRFGWSYEALMTMTGAERKLWLAAADKVAPAPAAAASTMAPVARDPAEAAPTARLTTEAERRARLLELSQEYAARYRR